MRRIFYVVFGILVLLFFSYESFPYNPRSSIYEETYKNEQIKKDNTNMNSTTKSSKDYDVDPSLNIRQYDEIKSEIKDNILKIADITKVKKKPVIYVWDFDNRSKYRVGASKIKDDISTILLESGMFKLVEDAAVEVALKEMNLSGTGFIDQNNIKELGNRLGIDYILYGTINNNSLAGGEPNLSVIFKLIEVETTKIVWAYEIGLNRKNFKTSIDNVIEEAIYKNKFSIANEWVKINKESIDSYGKNINSISVFFINTGSGIDDTAVVDKMISALVQSKLPGVRVVDRANLGKVVEFISKEGYEESSFFKTKKEFGKFYSVDAFLYGVLVRDPNTGKTELNLKLAMVESTTVDWGRKFIAEMSSVERESISKIQQQKFSESVSETVGSFTKGIWDIIVFILTAPGIGINIDAGWLGGFTTPAMTSKNVYGIDIFKDAIQLTSFNVSLDFFRLRVWWSIYLYLGMKFWLGNYITSEDLENMNIEVKNASFRGRLPYVGVDFYVGRDTSFRVSLLPIIPNISWINSRVEYVKNSYYNPTTYTFEKTIPINNYYDPMNWPLEFEFRFGDYDFQFGIIFGVWVPDPNDTPKSDFEWEFGFNFKVPIFWWHPFSFLKD